MKISEPMQRSLDLLAETLAPPSVKAPQKFVDEWNRYGEIRSREGFLEWNRQNMPERRGL